MDDNKSRLVWDIEANGLLSDSTEIWCISYNDITNKTIKTLSGKNLTRKNILDIMTKELYFEYIGHNIIGYDIPMLQKFFDINLYELVGIDRIVDTYIYSKVLWPDRPMPRGCPESLKNPVTNRIKKIGPHGLEAWAWRVGERKLAIHDWTVFTPEIIKRCEGDTIINEKMYYLLLKEAGIEL